MQVFHFRQNNSGAIWRPPAVHVFIEAEDQDTAEAWAEDIGIIFGWHDSCECCGPRWTRIWDTDDIMTREEAIEMAAEQAAQGGHTSFMIWADGTHTWNIPPDAVRMEGPGIRP